ncbi:MAG: glutathione S-transferase family protein [Myxococcota bacterium]|nr:glutathione S-transferase family protein [Myxococcota bacterium]
MRLHWYWSTNPQKVRLALEELELSYELLCVDLTTRAQKETSYLRLHPRGKVPALEIDDTVLWESGAALLYLAEREQRLWPAPGPQRALALNLLFLESAAWQLQASVYFYNRVVMPFIGAQPDHSRLEKASTKIQPLLELLNQQLGDSEYLLDEFSLVDCAYAPWLPVLDLEAFPALEGWRDRLARRKAWQACEFTY